MNPPAYRPAFEAPLNARSKAVIRSTGSFILPKLAFAATAGERAS